MQDFLNHARPLDITEAEIMDDKPFRNLKLDEFKTADVIVDEEGKVYAIGGIDDSYFAPVVWMLCTTRVEERPIEFLRFTKRLLNDCMQTHTRLWNVVWKKNQLHIKWLKWMGAHFYEEHEVNKETFIRFEFVREGSK